MARRILLCITTSVILGLVSNVALHAQGEPAALPQEVIARIRELENEFRALPSVDKSSQANEVTVKSLIAIVGRDKSGDGALRTWAIRQLGKYPSNPDGLRLLIERIDYEVSLVGFDASPIWSFPAARTLVDAGVAARNELLLALGKPQSDRRLHLMAYVLMKLDSNGRERGSAAPITVFRLTREIEHLQAESNGPRGELSEEMRKRRATNIENLRRMIGMLLEPGFEYRRIPEASASQRDPIQVPMGIPAEK